MSVLSSSFLFLHYEKRRRGLLPETGNHGYIIMKPGEKYCGEDPCGMRTMDYDGSSQ